MDVIIFLIYIHIYDVSIISNVKHIIQCNCRFFVLITLIYYEFSNRINLLNVFFNPCFSLAS